MYPQASDLPDPNQPPPPQAYPHRSWSDNNVTAPSHQRRSHGTYGARSASFSASRPPSFLGRSDLSPPPPPPPVPPLPPSLLPGFQSPSLAHSDRDFFFTDIPRPSTQLSHPTPFARPAAAHPSTNPTPASHWPSEQSSTIPRLDEAPAIPRRPAYPNNGHFQAQEVRPISYAPVQHFPIYSSRRPMTTHGDIRFSDRSFAPALPPKPFTTDAPVAGSDSLPPPVPTKEGPSSNPDLPLDASRPSQVDLPSTLLAPVESSSLVSGHSRTQSADDVVRAMELSFEESQQRRNLPDIGDNLQRAPADSLAESSSYSEPEIRRDAQSSVARLNQTPPPIPGPSSGAMSEAAEAAHREAEAVARQLQRERDEKAAMRMVMEEEQERLAKEKRELEQREQDSKAAIRMLMQQEEERRGREKREFEQRDEEMARQQAEEEQRAQREAKEAQERRDAEMARKQAEAEEKARREEQQAQERRDAEMARRLAENDAGPSRVPASAPVPVSAPTSVPQSMPVIPVNRPTTTPGQRPVLSTEASGQGPPQYDDVVTSRPAPLPEKKKRSRPAQAHAIQSSSTPNEATTPAVRGRSTSTQAASLQERPEFVRSSTVGGGTVSSQASIQAPPVPGSGEKAEPRRPPSNVAGPSTAAAASANPPAPSRQSHPNSSPGPSRTRGVPASQGNSAELELLKGVAFGFHPPKTQMAPVQFSELPPCPPLPEVISLHPAPSPPFHLMALSWRHLMRVLAQFETRIEASVGAIAQAKDDSVLRVVVQFVKLPFTANEWRTILHLSIDQPVPANTSRGWRFANGDTTVLPYSFALGETPAHFNMSAMSHLYAVPVSATTPFPILPLALPNLALYLQSAMRDSRARKVQNDATNGMRRLARIVTECYPTDISAEPEERESGRGMGGLFKRVVGAGRKRKDTQGNEDVYDMVTPFRIDKYTTVA